MWGFSVSPAVKVLALTFHRSPRHLLWQLGKSGTLLSERSPDSDFQKQCDNLGEHLEIADKRQGLPPALLISSLCYFLPLVSHVCVDSCASLWPIWGSSLVGGKARAVLSGGYRDFTLVLLKPPDVSSAHYFFVPGLSRCVLHAGLFTLRAVLRPPR